MSRPSVHPASFRDPAGFVFVRDGTLLRQVNQSYQPHYDRLLESGLYKKLLEQGLLVQHEEADRAAALVPETCYKVLLPQPLPWITYPYEWCFGQLRAAALATLKITLQALEHGMWLKDASAYNIQFNGHRPVLLDTLSFETYEEGRAWPAYRQFCEHFLGPLALMRYRDARLGTLCRSWLDGLPLDLVSSLLPWRSWLSPALLGHVHLHSLAQGRQRASRANLQLKRSALIGLLESLESCVRGLRLKATSAWARYYETQDHYSDAAMQHKLKAVGDLLEGISERSLVWDLGANVGRFSRLPALSGSFTVSMDNDPCAVEENFRSCCAENHSGILPLVMDLTNPSPSQGWNHEERSSLVYRGPADVVLALALVHHLVIANNTPWERVVGFLAEVTQHAIVEFVPRSDVRVAEMLRSREHLFPHYNESDFVASFAARFKTKERVALPDSDRVLFHFELC